MGLKRDIRDKHARKDRAGQYNGVSPREGPAPIKGILECLRRAKRKQKSSRAAQSNGPGAGVFRNVGEEFIEYKGIKFDTAYLRNGKLIRIRDFLRLRGVTAGKEKAALVREFNNVIKRDYHRLLSLIQRDGTQKVTIGRRPLTYFVEFTVTTEESVLTLKLKTQAPQ